MASQSGENKPYYEDKEIGYNYRIGPLSAARGLLGFSTIDKKLALSRQLFESYKARLKHTGPPGFPDGPHGSLSNRWLTAILVPEGHTERLQRRFKNEGIETRPLWKPMHEQPVFQTFNSYSRGIASGLFNRGITLPSSDPLTEKDQEKITSILLSELGYGGG